MRRRLTPEERRAMRSLIEDSGYSEREARELVLAGFWDDPDRDPSKDPDWQEANAEAQAEARAERDRDDLFVPDADAAE